MRKIIITVMAIITVLAMSGIAWGFTGVSVTTGKTYTHNDRFADHLLVDGADVSAYQTTINWKQAKADGMDFAVIRVGGRGYGAAGNLYKDIYFVSHMKGAKNAGMATGVYFFSQATSEKEAIAEADYCIDLIEAAGYGPADMDLPVFMDYEFASGKTPGRLHTAGLSKTEATAVARAFCKEVEARGYTPGIYANITFLSKTINGASLARDYFIWAAHYNSTCQYSGTYSMWQYTSTGKFAGFKNSSIDCNYWYIQPAVEASQKKSIVDCDISIKSDTSGYIYDGITNYEPEVKVKAGLLSNLKEGEDYQLVYLKNVQAGTAYIKVTGIGKYSDYVLIPFTIKRSSDISGIKAGKIEDCVYNGKSQIKDPVLYDAQGNKLEWKTDYSKVTTYYKNAGQAQITVTFTKNYKGKMTITYNILKGKQELTIGNRPKYIVAGADSFNLNASLKFTDGAITYESSDPEVAAVSENGDVQGISGGEATIKVTASGTENYEGVTGTYKVRVLKDFSDEEVNSLLPTLKFKASANILSNGNISVKFKNNEDIVSALQQSGLATEYKFYRSTSKSSGYKLLKAKDQPKLINNSKLVKGQKYYYRVCLLVYRIYDADGREVPADAIAAAKREILCGSAEDDLDESAVPDAESGDASAASDTEAKDGIGSMSDEEIMKYQLTGEELAARGWTRTLVGRTKYIAQCTCGWSTAKVTKK